MFVNGPRTFSASIVRNPFASNVRIRVIVGQAIDVMVDRVQTRCGEHAGLTQPAAEHLAPAMRRIDQVARTDEDRADRRAESLRQADGHGVERLREFRDGSTRRDRCVEHARAVEMHRETALARERCDVLDVRLCDDAAAGRVLERDQARAREVVVGRLDRRAQFGERQRAVFGVLDRLRLDAAEHRRTTRFVLVGVRVLADEVLVATRAVRHEGREIALRARRHEDRRLLAE